MIVSYDAPPASAPEPRLTARSMLSLGTEDFLAFWIASYRVGLPAGSPPPVRAATSMFLISLANILPRLASTTAFLCFVVAHLEWPDIALPPGTSGASGENSAGAADHLDEEPVHADIPGDLGVERRREQVALPHRDDSTRGGAGLDLREHLHLRRHVLDPRRADEHRPHGRAVHTPEGE